MKQGKILVQCYLVLLKLLCHNSSLIKRIPGGEALAGLLAEDSKGVVNPHEAATTATFTRKNTLSSHQDQVEEAEHITRQAAATGLDALLVYQLKQLQDTVPPGDDRQTLLKILQVFTGNPRLIKEIWDLLDEAYRKQVLGQEVTNNNLQEKDEEFMETSSGY